MSIATEITRINTNIANAYTQAENKGATMPGTENSENLAITIASISMGDYTSEQIKALIDKSITSFIIPDGTTIIGYNIFRNCSLLTDITIPNSVITIDNLAFQGCSSLVNIALPSDLITIGQQAFYQCTNLASITIPSSVTSIGDNTFRYSGLLTAKILSTTPPTAGVAIFANCPSLTRIEVPNASLSAYQSATNWSPYAGIMVGV